MFTRRQFIVCMLVANFFSPLLAFGQTRDALVFDLPIVTNTAGIRTLSRIQSSQGWPLRLEGVVTMADPAHGWLVLQDSQGAAKLHLDFASRRIMPGQLVQVESDNAAGYAPSFPEFPLVPSGSQRMSSLSVPTNFGDFYLARMHGYLVPPATGDYTFWVASKGSSELWFSTNTDAAGLQRIAFVPTGRTVNPGQWNKIPSQTSATFHLVAQRPCLFDFLYEIRSGHADVASVAWQGPGIPQSVIDGRYLISYSDHEPNSVMWECWNNFFPATVQPLTAGESVDPEVTVMAPQIQGSGEASFPDPIPLKAGAPLAMADNFKWAEMEGTVRFVAADTNGVVLELAQGQARTTVHLSGAGDLNLGNLLGARIRVRGACEAAWNENSNSVAGALWVPDPKELMVTRPGGDMQTLRTLSIGDITPANPWLAAGRSIRIHGTVLGTNDGQIIIQGDQRFSGYLSTNGINWKEVAAPVEIPLGTNALGGLMACSSIPNVQAVAIFDGVHGVNAAGDDLVIGDESPKGSTKSEGAGGFTLLSGGGTGFGSTFERFHFFCEELKDKAEVAGKLEHLESGDSRSEAGIMMRDSASLKSSFVSLTLISGGVAAFRFRQGEGERNETINISGFSAPCWLRLARTSPQLVVQMASNVDLKVGDAVDLAGRLQWNGNQPVLSQAYRVEDAVQPANPLISAANDTNEPPLINIAPLLPADPEASFKEGSGSVAVRGVVTFSGPAFGSNYLVIQDATAGAQVKLNGRFARRTLEVGNLVEFELRSLNGKWPVPLDPNRIEVMGQAQLPVPSNLSRVTGSLRRSEGRWVEGQGIVRVANASEGLELMYDGGMLPVWVEGGTDQNLARYVDALVRIRGVLVWRENKLSLLAPSFSCFQMMEAPPDQPFDLPAISLADLKAANRRPEMSHRVKVAGAVTYQRGGILAIQDDSGGVYVRIKTSTDVAVGDEIEMVGFPEGRGNSMTLSQALVRMNGTAHSVATVPAAIGEMHSGDNNGRLIQFAAELIGQEVKSGSQVIELQADQKIIRAAFLGDAGQLPAVPVGSRLRITGISVRTDVDPIMAGGSTVDVLLRTANDVKVLQLPPWWTLKHAAVVIGSLGLVLVAALLWIRSLQKRVSLRTRELEVAMDRLEKETRTSATLAERERLAGEIHDSVEQGLSAIMMQMEIATDLVNQPEEVKRFLTMARNMAGFSRAEVHHAVWNLQSPLLENATLAEALQRIAQEISAGDAPRITVRISGKEYSLPSSVAHHLLRIGQEAMTNAVRHGHPQKVDLDLNFADGEVALTIRDDGCGFDPRAVNARGGHFGLPGMQDRALKIDAILTVNSEPGQGTSIKVIVRLEKGAQDAPTLKP